MGSDAVGGALNAFYESGRVMTEQYVAADLYSGPRSNITVAVLGFGN